MPLVLTIVNVERLENGVSTRLQLDRHGALIGRAPHTDWSLPDAQRYISSEHCEVEFRDGAYVLFDKSSNGTFINGSSERMRAPHVIGEGDEITIGRYRIKASLSADATPLAPPPVQPSAAPVSSGGGWGDAPPAPVSQTPNWGAAPMSPTPLGGAPASPGFAPNSGGLPPMAPAPGVSAGAHAGSAGGWADDPPAQPASSWGREPAGQWGAPEAAPDPWAAQGPAISGRGAGSDQWTPPPVSQGLAAPAASDIWSKMAASNEVDWARGGFGQPAAEPAPVAVAPPPPASAPDAGAWQALLEAAGLGGVTIKAPPREAAAAAGGILRRLIAGLVVMLEARARAKAQLGASGTRLEFEGNNPLKFARGPEQALTQMLASPERGFMPAYRAVEDAFQDLQAHQMATLVAMQGALRATLDRFSPAAIRQRASGKGVGLFGSKKAALWEAYEREFEGVAQGSDEAFMDVFAKAFREAYEQAARQPLR